MALYVTRRRKRQQEIFWRRNFEKTDWGRFESRSGYQYLTT
jgi:hypothetical protein